MQKMILSWLKGRIATKGLKELVSDAKLKDCLEVVNDASIEEFRSALGGSRRSVHIREVDAGSCNACDLEINALNNPVYDIERFGIHFVASPRHADMLLVTGPVTRNMEMALRKTYEATPKPRLVVAVGGCARDGGIFKGSYAVVGGVERVIPVDAYIRGCPPRPQELLYGILRILGRI